MSRLAARVARELRACPGEHLYAVLDAARSDGVLRLVECGDQRFACLYTGAIPRAVAEAAPWLVRFEPGAALLDRLVDEGWGDAWGVFASSSASFEEVYRHAVDLLRVRTAAGRELLFRYYDPRVLRAHLPGRSRPELAALFGPLSSLAMEDHDPRAMLVYARSGASYSLRRASLSP